MAMLDRIAVMISPLSETTASPVDTSVLMHLKGMLNLPKSFTL
jgi:hypothetical protein